MRGMARRLADLEAKAGDLRLVHLSDDELREHLAETYRELAALGLVLPLEWETQLHADPMGFHRKMIPQLDAMEAVACEA